MDARMATAPVSKEFDGMLYEQLVGRQQKLREATTQTGYNADFARLLNEVDAALTRFEKGTFGICEECHDPIEPERLLADPLIRVCLGDLTAQQRAQLENDLELAAEIQLGLLPKRNQQFDYWQVDFVYQPAGIVSGDYVDVIPEDGHLYFILGDVSGKGMAASLLMSSLHAMFHSLIPLGLPLSDLMSRANRILCESTLANQFATLVLGRANSNGEVEICNAGHLPPLVIGNGEYTEVNSAGLPLGMFCDVQFDTSTLTLGSEDTLLLYSDGVTEATDESGTEFGLTKLLESVNGDHVEPGKIVRACLSAVETFRGRVVRTDDLTLMELRFAGATA